MARIQIDRAYIMGLTIRKMRKDDLTSLSRLLADPEVMRYIEPPYTEEQTADFLRFAGLSDPPLIRAAEDEQGRFIGYVIYHDYDQDSKEIGWVLVKEVWGLGYAESLTAQLLERARAEGKNAVIECDPGQSVTKHIAGKFGFEYVGIRNGCEVFKKDLSGGMTCI